MSLILKTPSNGSVTLAEQDTASDVTVTIPATTGNAVISTPDLAYSPFIGFRNRIINGGMTIDQRNAGASITPASGAYTLDRWAAVQTTASKFSVQQNAGAVTPPVGFVNYLGVTSLSAYSVLSSDAFAMVQRIEGTNVSDLGWGTANAQAVTLSFWVRSSLTGTFGGALRNSAADRSYPFSYSISAANTWEQKTVTIAGDTTGTWLTTNGIGINVFFSLGAGATFSGTAGAWAGADYRSATGATSVVGTNGATFYITGVQLEKGSTATPFEFRSIGQELGLCQRYYYRTPELGNFVLSGFSISTTVVNLSTAFPVTMRANPTALEQSGTASHYLIRDRGGNKICTAVPAFLYGGPNSGAITMTTTGLTQGDGVIGYSLASGYFAWSAEL
jgi:hypothetical protein